MKVLNDSGSGLTSWIICGIERVTKHNTEAGLEDIEVANMSLGGSGGDSDCSSTTSTDSYHKAICNSTQAGVTYVAAAGNGRKDLKNFRPATYDEVLTVTAAADFNGTWGGSATATCRSDVDDTAANFSNFTTIGHPDEGHTIAAPGVCITSTWRAGAMEPTRARAWLRRTSPGRLRCVLRARHVILTTTGRWNPPKL